MKIKKFLKTEFFKSKNMTINHFMSEKEIVGFRQKYSSQKNTDDLILGDNIHLSMDRTKTRRNSNIMSIGNCGTGKTKMVDIPNIEQCNSNYIIFDTSNEILTDVKDILIDNGYQIQVVSVFDKTSTHYNPFSFIKNEEDIYQMADVILLNICPSSNIDKCKNSTYFKAEECLLTGLIAHIVNNELLKDKTLASMVYKLSDFYNNDNFKPVSEFEKKQYATFEDYAKENKNAIIIDLASRLKTFLIEDIKMITDTDTLTLSDFVNEKKAIFFEGLIIDSPFRVIEALFFMQSIKLIKTQQTGFKNRHVQIYTGLWRWTLTNIHEIIATLGLYNIGISADIQCVGQLQACFD